MGELSVIGPDEIDEVRKLEGRPADAGLVGQWAREEHLAEMASGNTRHLLWREDGQVTGFAILQNLGDPERNIHLRRIIVAEPGAGTARAMLPALIDWVFDTLDAASLDLNVFTHNARAQRAYLREGFEDRGLVGDPVQAPDGQMVRRHWMVITRERWRSLRG
jgi:diamine N-acetyltransferase